VARNTGPTKAQLQRLVDTMAEHDITAAAAGELLGMKSRTAQAWKKQADKQGVVSRKNSPAALKQQIRLLKGQLRKSEKEEDTAAKVRETLYNLSARSPEPPKWLDPIKTKKVGNRGCPMTLWSDWHYGEVVRPEEVGGVNEFNADVAAKRVTKLVDTTLDLCFNHMGATDSDYPGVVVALGGDMISGDIHDELRDTNDRTPYQAVNDLTDIIASALERMADAFGKVFVPCVVGNHGRGTQKPRMKTRIFTSFEWNIYCNLERYFKDDKRISFFIPEETDAFFAVYGHRFLLTHGDSLGVRGGDGIIGSLGPIMRGTIKTSRSEAQIDREFDTILMGHWHQYITLPGLVVNNSLKGYDEFARLALRAPYSRPSQALWFCHPVHGITAHWQVYLEAENKHADGKKWVEVFGEGL
jgi:predicted phosphodiesterase